MGTILDRRGPIQRMFKAAENLAEARRQVTLATTQAIASALNASNSLAARDAAFGYAHFYATRAEGVAALAVGAYFTSAETGTPRMYQRTGTAPYYIDKGDAAAPVSKASVAATVRDATGGTLTLEQFASPGFTYYKNPGDRGTDWTAPLNAALDAINRYAPVNAIWSRVPRIELQMGGYFFGQHIDLKTACHLHGHGGGLDDFNGGTRFVFPAGQRGITVNESNTIAGGTTPGGTSARGTVLEGLQIMAEATTGGTAFDGTNPGTNTCGVWLRAAARLRGCTVQGFAGNAIQVVAFSGGGGAIEGNASKWELDTVLVRESLGWGLYVNGNDANTGVAKGLQVRTAGLGGIWDRDTLGNGYNNCEIDGYAGVTADFVLRAGCNYGGVNYILVDPTPGIGASTTPGTNPSVWYPLYTASASDFFLTWSGSANYRCMLPVLATGLSNRSTFIQTYIEGSIPGHLANTPSLFFGGQSSWTNASAGNQRSTTQKTAIYSPTGFGRYYGTGPGTTERTQLGDYVEATIGGGTPGTIWRGRIQKNGEIDYAMRFSGSSGDLVLDKNDGGYPLMKITTPLSSAQFGRSAAVSDVVGFQQLALVDPADGGNSRMLACGLAAPTSGEHAAGERWWNASPGAGKPEYWLCIAGGTPGTWIGVNVQPFLSGSPISLTGATALTTLVEITIPGGVMGPKGVIDVDAVFSMTGSAGTKTASLTFGASGAGFWANTYATNVTQARFTGRISNAGSVSAQVGGMGAGAGNGSNGGGSPTKTTLNTASNQSLKITGQLASGADTLVLESYAVRITPGA